MLTLHSIFLLYIGEHGSQKKQEYTTAGIYYSRDILQQGVPQQGRDMVLNKHMVATPIYQSVGMYESTYCPDLCRATPTLPILFP